MPQETLDAVLDDWRTADISEKTRAALMLLETMTLRPQKIDEELLTDLRQAGLDNLAIQEAANVGFHYNLIDRVADAFDFPVPEGLQQERLARMLNFTGGLLRGSEAEEVWVRGEGGVVRPPEVEKGREHLLSVDGATTPDLRRAVEAFVVSCWGGDRNGDLNLPQGLDNYLKKLALHAYKIVDEDLEAIKEQGYTDEMIYEITIVGAVGAALVGLEAVYKYLY